MTDNRAFLKGRAETIARNLGKPIPGEARRLRKLALGPVMPGGTGAAVTPAKDAASKARLVAAAALVLSKRLGRDYEAIRQALAGESQRVSAGFNDFGAAVMHAAGIIEEKIKRGDL